jgi:hypothetical protein
MGESWCYRKYCQPCYKVEYYIQHPDCYAAEKRMIELMKPFALARKNEWYEINLEIAKNRLDETLEEYNNAPPRD